MNTLATEPSLSSPPQHEPVAGSAYDANTSSADPAATPRSRFGDWCRRYDSYLVTLLLAALTVAAYPDVFFRAEAIAPADLIFSHRPWVDHRPPEIVGGSNPVLTDQVDMFVPQVEYVRQCLKRGEIPFWCDKIQNGTPFFYVIKHELMVLPLLIAVLILKTPVGMTAYFLLRHLLGGLFFYQYGRIIGISRWASLCGAIVFCYCKYAVQDFIFPMHLQLMLLPILAYGTERIIQHRSLAWTAALPLLLWTLLLAGFPAGSAYCLYFLGLYTAFRILGQSGRRLKLAAAFAGIYLLPFVMAAPALLATADFFSAFDWSYRERYWQWRLPIAGLVAWVFPYFYGPPYQRGGPIGTWYEYTFYIGILPLVTTMLGFVYFRLSWIRAFYLVFAAWLIALLYNVGNILEHFVQYLPVFNSNPNTRQKLLLAFVLAVLLAYALDDLARRRAPNWARWMVGVMLLLLLGAGGWGVWSALTNDALSSFVRSALQWQTGVIVVSAAVCVALYLRNRTSGLTKVAVVLVIFLDLQVMDKCWYPLSRRELAAAQPEVEPPMDPRIAVGWNPTLARTAFYLRTPAVRFMKARIGDDKMLGMDSAFLANIPLFYDLNNFSGRGFFNARTKGLYRLLNDDALREHPTQFLFDSSVRTRLGSPIVDMLGIRYVALDSKAKLDDLARDYLLKQPEWNHTQELGPGQSLRQTFKAPRTMTVRRVSIRIPHGKWTGGLPAELRVIDFAQDKQQTFTESEWLPEVRRLEFDIGEFDATAGSAYAIELAVNADIDGVFDVLCTRDVDIIKSGTMSVDGKVWPGDLTFSVHSESSGNLEKYQIIYDDELVVLENTQVYGRAWLAGGLRYAAPEEVLSALASETGDLRASIWAEDDMRPIAGDAREPAMIEGRVENIELRSSYQQYQVEADRDCYLVVSDNYDHGWRAWIDGRETGVFRANYNLRAIALPKGQHTVEFRYRPPYFLPAMAISILATLGHFYFVRRLARRRRAALPEKPVGA